MLAYKVNRIILSWCTGTTTSWGEHSNVTQHYIILLAIIRLSLLEITGYNIMRQASMFPCWFWHFCIMSLQTFSRLLPIWLSLYILQSYNNKLWCSEHAETVVIAHLSFTIFFKSTFDTENKYFCRHTQLQEERLVLLLLSMTKSTWNVLFFLLFWLFSYLLCCWESFVFGARISVLCWCSCVSPPRQRRESEKSIKTSNSLTEKKVKRKHFIAVSCNIFS